MCVRGREKERDTERESEREIQRERQRERQIERDFYFFESASGRTDNPSLAVKILNDTPIPNVPSLKGLVRNSQ